MSEEFRLPTEEEQSVYELDDEGRQALKQRMLDLKDPFSVVEEIAMTRVLIKRGFDNDSSVTVSKLMSDLRHLVR